MVKDVRVRFGEYCFLSSPMLLPSRLSCHGSGKSAPPHLFISHVFRTPSNHHRAIPSTLRQAVPLWRVRYKIKHRVSLMRALNLESYWVYFHWPLGRRGRCEQTVIVANISLKHQIYVLMSTSSSQRSTFDVRPSCTLVEDLYWTGCRQIDSRGLSRDAHLTDLRGLAQPDCHSLVCWLIRTGRARGKSTATNFWVEHTTGRWTPVKRNRTRVKWGKKTHEKKTSEAVPSFLRIVFP